MFFSIEFRIKKYLFSNLVDVSNSMHELIIILNSLHHDLVCLAEERQGGHMLYEIIEVSCLYI